MTDSNRAREVQSSTAVGASRPPRTIPGGRYWLWAGVGLFALSLAAGLVRARQTGRVLPQVGVEYTTELYNLIRLRGSELALRDLRVAASIDFDNHHVVRRLVQEARVAGDRELVLRGLVALTRLKPEDRQVRHELVAELLEQRRFSDASAQARFAVLLDPEAALAHYQFGLASLGIGEKNQAAAAFQHALQLDPTLEQARLGLATALSER